MKEWLKEAVAFVEERGLVQHTFEVSRVACPNDWFTIDIDRGEFVDESVMCRVARQRSGSGVEAVPVWRCASETINRVGLVLYFLLGRLLAFKEANYAKSCPR